MAEEVLWVRIKPYNEKKGYKRRRHLAFGMRFDESLGWYKVPTQIDLQDGRVVDVSEYLGSVRNDNEDPESPLVFDVMSEKEARGLDAKEKKAAELRATAVDARPVRPVDMTTADLAASGEEAPRRMGIPGVRSAGAKPVARPRRNAGE